MINVYYFRNCFIFYRRQIVRQHTKRNEFLTITASTEGGFSALLNSNSKWRLLVLILEVSCPLLIKLVLFPERPTCDDSYFHGDSHQSAAACWDSTSHELYLQHQPLLNSFNFRQVTPRPICSTMPWKNVEGVQSLWLGKVSGRASCFDSTTFGNFSYHWPRRLGGPEGYISRSGEDGDTCHCFGSNPMLYFCLTKNTASLLQRSRS